MILIGNKRRRDDTSLFGGSGGLFGNTMGKKPDIFGTYSKQIGRFNILPFNVRRFVRSQTIGKYGLSFNRRNE